MKLVLRHDPHQSLSHWQASDTLAGPGRAAGRRRGRLARPGDSPARSVLRPPSATRAGVRVGPGHGPAVDRRVHDDARSAGGRDCTQASSRALLS